MSHILSAYEIDGTGKGIPLTGQTIADKLKANELAWVHLDVSHEDTRDWLRDNVSYLDNIILDALLAGETRPRLMEHNDGLLVILRGVNLNENEEPEDMISIRAWIDPHRIITTRLRKLKAVQDIRTLLEEGNGPKNAADFIALLCTRLIQRMEPVLLDLDQQTDDVEEAIIEAADAKYTRNIIDIRKQAIMLRRYISPQKDVLSYLRSSDINWINVIHKRQIQENLDRITRYIEDLDAIRERAQLVKDELSTILADRMNKNMYVLSIVAAIFLPLGFLTGLLGINVGGMPGANDDMAFWIVCAMCAGFVVLITAIFKWFKWI